MYILSVLSNKACIVTSHFFQYLPSHECFPVLYRRYSVRISKVIVFQGKLEEWRVLNKLMDLLQNHTIIAIERQIVGFFKKMFWSHGLSHGIFCYASMTPKPHATANFPMALMF